MLDNLSFLVVEYWVDGLFILACIGDLVALDA